MKNKDKKKHSARFNKASIPEQGLCGIIVYHKDKQSLCIFFIGSGSGLASLGMLDIKMLDTIHV